jgi:hypothetical protein
MWGESGGPVRETNAAFPREIPHLEPPACIKKTRETILNHLVLMASYLDSWRIPPPLAYTRSPPIPREPSFPARGRLACKRQPPARVFPTGDAKGTGGTRFVEQTEVALVKHQLARYARLRARVDRWIDIGTELADLARAEHRKSLQPAPFSLPRAETQRYPYTASFKPVPAARQEPGDPLPYALAPANRHNAACLQLEGLLQGEV